MSSAARTAITLMAASVTVLGGIAGYFATATGDRTCQSLARRGAFLPVLCSESVKEVSVDEAVVFIDKFFGRAGASTPKNAWRMLADEVQAEVPVDDFEAAWKPVHWAERIGAVEPGEAFNSFFVRYRTYKGSTASYSAKAGSVTERHTIITLRKKEPHDGVEASTGLPLEISDLGPADRDRIDDVRFVQARLTQTVTPVERPSRDAQPTAPQPASVLAAYCMVVSEDPTATPWVRTGLGWIPVDGTAVTLDGTPPLCDSHHVVN